MSVNDKPWVLAIDQGGHASRALVFAGDGREIARAHAPVATQHPRTGWVEHEPAQMLGSILECLRSIAESLGADASRIGSAALATQRSSLVCWSRESGAALSPVLSWQDVRGARLLEQLALDPEEIHATTGLRISPHYGASKMRWCLENIDLMRNAARSRDLAIGPLASWLTFALSDGQCCAVDPCNASRTLLWDVQARDWSRRLLDLFGIAHEQLPCCRPNAGHWCWLRVGDAQIPLTVVTGDQSAVPYAFEPTRAGDTFLTLGTGAFVQQIEGSTPTAAAGLLNSVLWEDEETVQYALEGTINGAGAALSWLAEHDRISETDILAGLPKWLADDAEPPLFVNAIGGLAAPFWKSHGQSEFVGGSGVAGRAVAVVESIAFLVQANLDAMRAAGKPVRQLIAVGGLSSLDGLLGRIATLAGVPVLRAAHGEATAYGAARLAVAGLPALATGRSFLPDARREAALRSRYLRCLEKWQNL